MVYQSDLNHFSQKRYNFFFGESKIFFWYLKTKEYVDDILTVLFGCYIILLFIFLVYKYFNKMIKYIKYIHTSLNLIAPPNGAIRFRLVDNF